MSKVSKKRYWKNWNELIVPMNTVATDFQKEFNHWAAARKLAFVIRTGSRKVEYEMTNDRGRTWTDYRYESFYRVWIKNKTDVTLVTMTWL